MGEEIGANAPYTEEDWNEFARIHQDELLKHGQDRGMGQTNTRSRSSSPRQERQTSGAGGLHSGY